MALGKKWEGVSWRLKMQGWYLSFTLWLEMSISKQFAQCNTAFSGSQVSVFGQSEQSLRRLYKSQNCSLVCGLFIWTPNITDVKTIVFPVVELNCCGNARIYCDALNSVDGWITLMAMHQVIWKIIYFKPHGMEERKHILQNCTWKMKCFKLLGKRCLVWT